MIILNCGMKKSGTSLVMEYQRDLVRHSMIPNGLQELNKYSYKGFISKIDLEISKELLFISNHYGDLVVKTHDKPSAVIQDLIAGNAAKASFCYRDPRDGILSAIDHGARSRKGLDPTKAFAKIRTVADAIPLARANIESYYQWVAFGNVLLIRYSYPLEILDQIYQKHEDLKEKAWNFNTGSIHRWKSEMTPQDLSLCNQLFQQDLLAMGYEV
jgi:hypothetical protein